MPFDAEAEPERCSKKPETLTGIETIIILPVKYQIIVPKSLKPLQGLKLERNRLIARMDRVPKSLKPLQGLKR